jgi:acyl-coenzyme A thioesterase 9
MEDLDVLAAMAAYKHCWAARPARPLTIVTASVDRMDLLNMLRPDLDMRASGHVTYVGRSSMEGTSDMIFCFSCTNTTRLTVLIWQ